MKISKLFHWLYASLMLLPILICGGTILYYGLNQNAQLSERTEQQPIYYQSNEVNTQSDLHEGNIYYWNDNLGAITPDLDLFRIDKDLYNYIYPQSKEIDRIQCFTSSNGGLYLLVYFTDNTSSWENIQNRTFPFIITGFNTNSSVVPNDMVSRISSTDFLWVKEYVNITTNNDISTSIINAWNSTWQNPLFSWSGESFMTAPFNYLGNLFSIPNNSTFTYALSYWSAISIVWLVFDIFMYVPLLAHRWIDKAKIE